MEKEIQTMLAEQIAEGIITGILSAILFIILCLLFFTIGFCIAEAIDKKRNPAKYEKEKKEKQEAKNLMRNTKYLVGYMHEINSRFEELSDVVQTNQENIDTLFNKLEK